MPKKKTEGKEREKNWEKKLQFIVKPLKRSPIQFFLFLKNCKQQPNLSCNIKPVLMHQYKNKIVI